MFSSESMRALPKLRALLASALLLLAAVPAVAFHFPWDQGHDTTNSNDPPPPGPCEGPTCDPCNDGGTRSPVYAATGHCYWTETDVVLRGRPYIGLTRSFNSNDPVLSLFGNGWTIDFDVSLYPANKSGVQQRIYKAPNGKRFSFVRQPDGSFTAPAGRFETVVEGASSVIMTSLDGSRHVFALDGRLLERVDNNGNRVIFSYDPAGRVVRMADENGRFLALTYNGSSLIDSVADHGGRTWRYGYDLAGNLLTVTDPALGVLRYTYAAYRPTGDAFSYSLLTRVVDPSGVEAISFSYANGRVVSYSEGANLYTYTRPISNTTLAGTVTRTDRLGSRQIFVYGALGLVTRDTDALNFVRTYTYDANGRRLTEVDELNGTWSSTYDSLGRVLTRRNPLGETSTIGYAGSESRPAVFTSPSGRVTRLQYDSQGNMTLLTDPLGAVTRIAWNPKGDPVSLTDAVGSTSATVYNAAGQPLTVTDPLGRLTSYQYDVLGRLSQRTNPAGDITAYTYDVLDRVTAITDPLGNVISIEYDPAGRILAVTDQKGSRTSMAYDTFGRLVRETAPDGRVTTYAYRLDNLLDRITQHDGTVTIYGYDANKRMTSQSVGGDVVSFSYNARGDLTLASGPGGSVSRTYDAAGRLASETSNGRTLTLARNAEGERVQLTLQGGGSTQYGRDARGDISQITAAPGSFTFTRDALGRRTRVGLPNGSAAAYAFDAAGQLQSLSHDGAFNAQYQYTYDPAGRILGIAGSEAGWTYAYDRLGRLLSATRQAQSYAYAYDVVGNLVSDGAQHDVNHRLVQDANKNYSYDARGNLTLEQHRGTGALVAYTWNARNQLTKVEYFASAAAAASRTLTFTYDPLGRRASKTDSGVLQKFVYDGYDLLAALDAGNTTLLTNIMGPGIDDPLATTTGGGVRYYHTDHIGSVVALSDASSVTTRFGYDPYGATTITGETPAAAFAYTARERDDDDLYYYRTRYYSPAKKRFLSEDSIGISGGLNLYGYADGDPISNNDPSGECPMCLWAAAQYARCLASCAAISAVANAATGGCAGAGDILGDCALDCINPLNWGGKGAAKAGAKPAVKELRRPYIRKSTREQVEAAAPRDAHGRPIDPNTGRPIEGKPDLGHKPGNEHWREKQQAEAEGLTQKEFNDRMNDPSKYQLEDPSSNRSRRYEKKD
jgi:RHS repeat-associated protein